MADNDHVHLWPAFEGIEGNTWKGKIKIKGRSPWLGNPRDSSRRHSATLQKENTTSEAVQLRTVVNQPSWAKVQSRSHISCTSDESLAGLQMGAGYQQVHLKDDKGIPHVKVPAFLNGLMPLCEVFSNRSRMFQNRMGPQDCEEEPLVQNARQNLSPSIPAQFQKCKCPCGPFRGTLDCSCAGGSAEDHGSGSPGERSINAQVQGWFQRSERVSEPKCPSSERLVIHHDNEAETPKTLTKSYSRSINPGLHLQGIALTGTSGCIFP